MYHPLEMVPAAMSALCTHPHPRCCSAREQMPERDSVEKQGDTTADRGQNHRKQAHLALGLSTAHRAVAGRHLPGGGSVTDMLSPGLRLLGEVCAPSHQLSNLAVGVQRNRGEAERGPGAGAAHTPPGSHCTPMTPTCEAACPMLGPHPTTLTLTRTWRGSHTSLVRLWALRLIRESQWRKWQQQIIVVLIFLSKLSSGLQASSTKG